MKNKQSSLKIGVGTITILMVFVVLCMVILSILSYKEAQMNHNLSEKEKAYTVQYYNGQRDADLIQLKMIEEQEKGSSWDDIIAMIQKDFGVNVKIVDTNIVYNAIIDEKKHIHVELKQSEPNQTEVWKVESRR